MRLPYLQLEADFITSTAPVVAARAGISEVLALGMGVRLFSFAVTETGDRDRPPDGRFVDPDAADLLEHLLGWTGERGRLITAFERAGVIERLEIGLRVRGLHRYRRAWEKNARRTGKKPAPIVPATGAQPAETGGEPEKQTQTQTHIEDLEALAGETPAPDAPDDQPEEHDSPPTDGGREVASRAPPGPPDLLGLWNAHAHPALPRAQELTAKRRPRAVARLRERPDLEFWRRVIDRINVSRWCRGETDRSGWRASFDWLLQPDTAVKVLEGKYDDRSAGPPRDVRRGYVSSDSQQHTVDGYLDDEEEPSAAG